MTRLLLCTATILVLTASANAQALIVCRGADACHGQHVSLPRITGYTCAHTIAKGACINAPQPAQVQRSKQPRR
jgi:hypothetical protein